MDDGKVCYFCKEREEENKNIVQEVTKMSKKKKNDLAKRNKKNQPNFQKLIPLFFPLLRVLMTSITDRHKKTQKNQRKDLGLFLVWEKALLFLGCCVNCFLEWRLEVFYLFVGRALFVFVFGMFVVVFFGVAGFLR